MINKSKVLDLHAQGYSERVIASTLKVSKTAIHDIITQAGASRSQSEAQKAKPTDEFDIRLEHTLRKASKGSSIESLANTLDAAPRKVRDGVERLKAAGKNINVTDGFEISKQIIPNDPTMIDVSKFKGKTITFGLTGDNHLGSKYCRLDVLNALFDIWKDQGVDTVYQLGNMIDGDARFNKFDLLAHGMEEQVNYFVKNWPRREGMVTKFVTGDDHEGWYVQREGVDIGRVLQGHAREEGREDLIYLGHMEHDIIFKAPHGQSTMRLIHAGGGSAYATSYSAQKIVECVPTDTEALTRSGWKKPHDIHVGDEILGFNMKTGKNEWTKVQAINTGVADVVTYQNDRFKVRCTRNHKWVMDLEHRAGPNKRSKDPKPYRAENRELATIDDIAASWKRGRIVQAAESPSGEGTFTRSHEDWIDRKDAVNQVLAMTSDERKGFIYGMLVGEGHLTDGGTIVFSQNPGPVNAAFILACSLEGLACGTTRPVTKKINGEDKICARTTVLKKNRRMVNSMHEVGSNLEEVWCPTTALGTWVMRQGDLVTITGNSYQGGEKPNILLIGHYHKAEYGYPREVHCVQCGCTEDQTPFMRKLKIQAHVGGWTISFDIDDFGLVHKFTPQWHPFYDRGFYENSQWGYKFGKTRARKPTIVEV